MSRKTNISKAVTYRRCMVMPKPGQTLQQLISAALVNLTSVDLRTEPMDAQSTEVRVIGRHKIVSNVLCGYLSTWERGKSQAVITDDPQASSLSLGAVPPGTAKSGKKQEYIPGVLYFAVLDNHVALTQTTSMRGGTLESHFSWLLKSKTNSLPPTSSLVLSDEAQKATKERIRKSHVRSISFGQPLMTEFVPTKQTNPNLAITKINEPEKKRFRPAGPVVDFIKNYFDEQRFETLGFDSVLDGNLEVWIELRYPKRKRTQTEDTIMLMDNLGIGLRDIEGDQVTLELADGHRVSGKELRVSGSISTPLNAVGQPDEDNVWDALVYWLGNQIKNGVVDPD